MGNAAFDSEEEAKDWIASYISEEYLDEYDIAQYLGKQKKTDKWYIVRKI